MNKQTDKGLHPRNLHNGRYDFPALIKQDPRLKAYVSENIYGDLSIDFSNPEAVLSLNAALLSYFYDVKKWSIPKNYLCPPIPGRADYIHYMADLLAESNGGVVPKEVKVLDVGVGANCIYPIIGSSIYGWEFVGSDVDDISIKSAKSIVQNNETLNGKIEIQKQENPDNIFTGIIAKKDCFAFTLCNPPFHTSEEEASRGSQRKNRNLTKQKTKNSSLNFGGQANELWCPGGEVAFIRKMITQSVVHRNKVLWFSTLVSKKENLKSIYKALKLVNPQDVQTIEMKQGQKVTRIVAWSFIEKKRASEWFKKHANL